MLAFLPAVVRGGVAFLLLVLNTLAWCGALFGLALVKLALPLPPIRRRIDTALNAIATAWIACNGLILRLTQHARWDVAGTEALQRGGWYMVLCNHQSWADIFVLQQVLSGRVPLLKFFLKRQLLYVPVIGLAWWALDFPFLRRHGKSALEKRPELRLQDRDAARKACERFALVPTSVMSFPEGTRFAPAKHDAQSAPYAHLLRPRAGALALSLNAMGRQFRSLLDVTIVYPDGVPSFWRFLCGLSPRVMVRVRQLPIPPELCTGDYGEDRAFRQRFHRWLEDLWLAKDRQITAMLESAQAAPLAIEA